MEVDRLSILASLASLAGRSLRCLKSIPHVPEDFGEQLLGDALIVDPNAFPYKPKMRRGVQSYTGRQPLGMYTLLCWQVLGEY